jgi:aspartyl/asparaginyl beta-hydroxylase (cupin superfamily)
VQPGVRNFASGGDALTAVDPAALLASADDAMRRGDPQAAADLLERYLQAARPRAGDLLRLAAAKRALGDAVGALDAVSGAIRIEPQTFAALLMGGSLLHAMGRSEESARAYAMALAAAPPAHMLPPAIRAELDRARAQVEADAAWRSRVADRAAGDAPVSPRMARFRDQLARTSTGSGKADLNIPDLPVIPFFDPADFAGVAELEAATDIVREEFRTVVAHNAPELMSFIDHAGGSDATPIEAARRWSVINLILNGDEDRRNSVHCPETMRLYRALNPPAVAGRSPNLMFSLLDPGAHIPLHTGVTNSRLVIHLPLIVPSNCALRVGAETRAWQPGRAMIFDDTIEHEAWNRSDQLRVVLLGDLWHPALEAEERDAVAALLGRG